MITYPSTYGVFEAQREGAVRDRPRARRPRLCRRREHERAGRRRRAGRVRRRREPPEPAQDLLHPARRRRARASGRCAWSTTSCPSCPGTASAGVADADAPVGAVSARAARQRRRAADQLDVHPHDGRRRPAARATETAILIANYIAARLADHYEMHYSGNVAGIKGGGVAHECILDLRPLKEAPAARRQRRGRRQAADRLRLPRADAELPGRRHADGRADRERVARRARPLLRRDDRDPRRDREGRGAAPGRARTTRSRHAPHTADGAARRPTGRTRTRARTPPIRWRRCARAKYWSPVGRVDNVYGDRNLFCSCPPVASDEDID